MAQETQDVYQCVEYNVFNSDMITESYQGKAADLKEELGIEDDNDAGVNIDAALVKEM
jgi:hypothetical protein